MKRTEEQLREMLNKTENMNVDELMALPGDVKQDLGAMAADPRFSKDERTKAAMQSTLAEYGETLKMLAK